MHKFLFSGVHWELTFDYKSLYGEELYAIIFKYPVSHVFLMEFFFLYQPKLTMARCRRNVDNFLEACRKIGVEEVGANSHYFFEHATCCLFPFAALLQELLKPLQ